MSRRLLRFGAEALKPHFVDGRWQRPMISKRVAAKLRKEAILRGTYGPAPPQQASSSSSSDIDTDTHTHTHTQLWWDPAWDAVGSPKVVRPNKLHKRERDREERFQKIETAMAGMENKITQHKESLQTLKPKPGIETLFKKVVAQGQKRR